MGAEVRETKASPGRLPWPRHLTVLGAIVVAAAAAVVAYSFSGETADRKAIAPDEPVAFSGRPATDWQLRFADEFDGTELDSTVWANTDIHDWTSYDGEAHGAWTLAVNAQVGSGALSLVAQREAYEPRQGVTVPWTTAGVRTTGFELDLAPDQPDLLRLRYGFIEVRAQLAVGRGLMSTIWLVGTETARGQGAWFTEIELIEFLGDDSTVNHPNFFEPSEVDPSEPGDCCPRAVDYGTDLTAGMHVYGLEWTPTRLRWYFDGEVVQDVQRERTADIQAGVLLMELHAMAAGPANHGYHASPDQRTPDRSALVIDYVRIWQDPAESESLWYGPPLPEATVLPRPTIG